MWILVIVEYLKTNTWISLGINFGLSLIICFCIIFLPQVENLPLLMNQFINNSISVLSLLVGFTVAMFTLLITISNPNVDEIKTKHTEFILYNEPVTLYKIMLIRMAYIIVIESLLLLFNLIYPFLFGSPSQTAKVFFLFDAFLLTHIILANISNIVDLYFVLTKKDEGI